VTLKLKLALIALSLNPTPDTPPVAPEPPRTACVCPNGPCTCPKDACVCEGCQSPYERALRECQGTGKVLYVGVGVDPPVVAGCLRVRVESLEGVESGSVLVAEPGEGRPRCREVLRPRVTSATPYYGIPATRPFSSGSC